jgi:hypothetical protein
LRIVKAPIHKSQIISIDIPFSSSGAQIPPEGDTTVRLMWNWDEIESVKGH